MRLTIAFLLFVRIAFAAEPEFPLTEDSKLQAGVVNGTMIKDAYTAKDGSVFPGTQREYQIYLPAGHDKTKPAAFMVFQDGVIYQAPVVFDNLIAKKDIPPLVGIFVKPGVVPAANENALPRFNRSYEYDSITPTYSQFLIDELLPTIEKKHGIKLSTNPNEAAISGNSSGGICAFMVAWHRPDRFRRVFTGVGTYVGIHGADQLPVLVRKFEPKPIRVFLQSGTGDNNLYCGDWWMANQMMERSLTWAGYDVNHAWGEGGHNAKHASQIFPHVLRWLWRDWQTDIVVKANPKGESKWKGYEVVGDGSWQEIASCLPEHRGYAEFEHIASSAGGSVFWSRPHHHVIEEYTAEGGTREFASNIEMPQALAAFRENSLVFGMNDEASKPTVAIIDKGQPVRLFEKTFGTSSTAASFMGHLFLVDAEGGGIWSKVSHRPNRIVKEGMSVADRVTLSTDQTQLYTSDKNSSLIHAHQVTAEGLLINGQKFGLLEQSFGYGFEAGGLCVDTNGWLYVATSLGVQVLDQAGRVNFIIPTPKPALDVCFGGKDLSELFIACGDSIYKRPTKAKGVVSGQQAPIKPPTPKL